MAIQINGTTVIDNSRNLTNLGSAITAAQGGTGLTSPGANGNVLTSNGTAWTSAAPSGGGGGATSAGSVVAFDVNSGYFLFGDTSSSSNVSVFTSSTGTTFYALSMAISSYSTANKPFTSAAIPVAGATGGSNTMKAATLVYNPMLGMWVYTGKGAGGSNDGMIAYSPDGLSWTIDTGWSGLSGSGNLLGTAWNRYGGAYTFGTSVYDGGSGNIRVYYFSDGFTETEVTFATGSTALNSERMRMFTVDDGTQNRSGMLYLNASNIWSLTTSTDLNTWSSAINTGVTQSDNSDRILNLKGARNIVTNSTSAYLVTDARYIITAVMFPSVSVGATTTSTFDIAAFGANNSFVLLAGGGNTRYAATGSSTLTLSTLASPGWSGTVRNITWTGTAWLVATSSGWWVNTNTNPSVGSFTRVASNAYQIGSRLFGNITYSGGGNNDRMVMAARTS
jgi:hypothetical protein